MLDHMYRDHPICFVRLGLNRRIRSRPTGWRVTGRKGIVTLLVDWISSVPQNGEIFLQFTILLL